MLADKHRIEKEQNSQLRNQVAHLLQLEQDQKMQLLQRDSMIQMLQVGLMLNFLHLEVYIGDFKFMYNVEYFF